MDSLPSIPDFYRDRKIFITGGSGFMGKVLIEKLLRSCPDIHTIYLLLRPKKGKRPESRIQDVTRPPLFDRLREENPAALDKLRAIAGDVKELGLALSVEDRAMLQREVSVVFHSAASVRFDDPVKDAVLMNVRGTREVVNLALGMADLKVFLHLSTSFSNCDQGRVLEKIYPPPGGWDWNKAIRLAETDGVDDFITCLTPKMLGALVPNSYVFAKALGEQVINDHRHRLPLVIVRPSVVVSAFEEPLEGWVDNLNGPFALWTAVYTGVVRSTYGKGSVSIDMVPVDEAVKSMIFISWQRATCGLSGGGDEVPVYNCCSLFAPKNQFDFIRDLGQVAREFPTAKMIWYPYCLGTGSWTCFYVNLMLFHVAYGAVLDAILAYKNMKPMFGKIYRRLYTASVQMKSFTMINYTFDNARFLRLAARMAPADRPAFDYTSVRPFDAAAFKGIVIGGRQHVLHDPLDTMPAARRNIARLYWLDKIVKSASCLALVWALSATSAAHAAFQAASTLFAQELL